MAIQFYACIALLCFEIAICTVCVLPLPIAWRRRALEGLSKLWNQYPRARIVTKVTMAAMVGLLIDALYGVYRTNYTMTNPDAVHAIGRDQEFNLELMKQERNAFLAAFILFLFTLIYRFQAMVESVVLLENTIATNDEKSSVQQQEYLQLVKEKERLVQICEERGVPLPPSVQYKEEPIINPAPTF
eukprot:TRINITY_DN1519_c0_g1_i2.p1 TRINITY_DN1519_c0_g1~~TRINITY_DN1519_c0_g1_i2.p1  ORF type:complete len:187 (+),score=48.61 TRINITY_DN1519_c0_g1_i2:90-650(+)